MEKRKEHVGLVETVKVIGKDKSARKRAKFDTGARRSSIDEKLAAELGAGPIIRFIRVRSASAGKTKYVRRPVYRMQIEIKGKNFQVEINSTDRGHLKQKVLIGRDILHNNFIVDVEKSHRTIYEEDIKEGYNE
jgi:hypothetical protein